MKAVVQRIDSGSVSVDGSVVGSVGEGLVVFVAAHKDDSASKVEKMANRILGLRIFDDETGKMNLPLGEREILLISNFTIYGDTTQRRPSFIESASFELGEKWFTFLVQELRASGNRVETGIFGADMRVNVSMNGPVTVILET